MLTVDTYESRCQLTTVCLLSVMQACLTPSHPLCPSQTGGERTAVKKDKWRESKFYERQLVQNVALNKIYAKYLNNIFSWDFSTAFKHTTYVVKLD